MTKRGPSAPAVVTVEELNEIVELVKESGAFAFDVETRGNIHRHADVLAQIEYEWKAKLATLKTEHPTTLARSRQAIEDRWTNDLALDTLRNEVFWIGIAIEGRSWAIPMGHPNGEVLVKELRGDGSTVPPPGYRAITKTGKESMAKAKFFIPAVFSPAPDQLTQEQVFTALEPLFMDENIVKINQNIKFDVKSVAKYYGNVLPKGLFIDTMDLMHICNENLMNYQLGTITHEVFGFDPYWRDGKLGKTISTEPFSKACRYAHYDARWPWLIYKRLWRMISAVPTLFNALQIDLPCIRVVAQMEMNGINVHKREMKKLGKELDLDINNLVRDISQYASPGFNPASNPDKAHLLFASKKEGGLGLKPTKMVSNGPSVDEDSLRAQEGNHPVVGLLMNYAEVKKMKSTYVEGMIPLLHTVGDSKWLGRLHPQFHFHRTVTGRFSCVSGDTLITTSRGTFRFDEYLPQEGDLVPTHTGYWCPVVRKVFKGYEPMVSVRLTNGSVLQCTEEHRILTPDGWATVGSLSPGSEVYSHVGFKVVYGMSGEHTHHYGPVSRGPREAHYAGHCLGIGYSSPQRSGHPEPSRRWGEAAYREGPTLLTLQAGSEEPYAGQEWRPAPQLHRSDPRWSWVLDEEGGWQVCSGASQGLCRGSWDADDSSMAGRSSHQRGQDGRLSGQPRPGDFVGAWQAAQEVVTIAEVTPLGTMGVWDVEVAGDHSYVTHGFLNHNSSDPNLQNISRDGRIRRLFVAGPYDNLIVADYSQIEMRLMAMFSQDKAMLHIFENDIDAHTGTATVILGRPPKDSEERNIYGKVPNFLLGYKGGPKRLVAATNGVITLDKAKEIVSGYNKGYAGYIRWQESILATARKRGYVETMGGRRRRLPDLNADPSSQEGWKARTGAERQAINAIIQGTATEICKKAMVKLDGILEHPKCQILVQVHDELVTSVPINETKLWLPRIEEAMGQGMMFTDGAIDSYGVPAKPVKIVVDAHAAGSWSEAKA